MLDLAIAYRIYPGVSKTPAVFADDKLKLSTLCLLSFKRGLGPLKFKMWALLDGCPPVYEQLFRSCFEPENLEIIKLDKIGNLPTFMMQTDILCRQTEAEFVYYAEDDYFYLPDALVRIIAFARNNVDADFVTPYDHPGNYNASNGIEPHLIRPFDNLHWRTSSASCLTFLARRQALIETRSIFDSYGKKNDDGSLWLSLTQKSRLLNPRVHFKTRERRRLWLKAWFWGYRQILFKHKRRLWHAVPSLATHIESPCLAPSVNWHAAFEDTKDEALETVAQFTQEVPIR
jgi:hypothetical protein